MNHVEITFIFYNYLTAVANGKVASGISLDGSHKSPPAISIVTFRWDSYINQQIRGSPDR